MAKLANGGAKQKAGDRFALEFRAEEIALFATDSDGAWTELGAASLEAEDFSREMVRLRADAEAKLGVKPNAADLWLPESQILNIEIESVDLGAPEASARTAIEAALEDATVLRLDELVYEMAPSAKGWAASAAETSVVEEARAYARKWGFTPQRTTTRYGHAAFSMGPSFAWGSPVAGASKAGLYPMLYAGAGLAAAAAVALFILFGSGAQRLAEPTIAMQAPAMPTSVAAAAVADPAPESRTLTAANIVAAERRAKDLPAKSGRLAMLATDGDVEEAPEPEIGLATTIRAPSLVSPQIDAPPQARPALDRPVAASPVAGPPPEPGGSLDAATVPPDAAVPRVVALRNGASAPRASDPLLEALAGLAGPPTPPRLALYDAPSPPRSAPGEVVAEEDIPGPGAVASAPAPAKRPAALDMTPSERVAKASPSPKSRPRAIKPRPRAIASNTGAARQAARPARGAPAGPGVANAATLVDAINLDEMSLLGVYGSGGSRRALLRLPSGEIMRVSKGAVVDGWVVSRINAKSMRVTRGGQAATLNLIQ